MVEPFHRGSKLPEAKQTTNMCMALRNEQIEWLKKYAYKQGKSLAQTIREIIDAYKDSCGGNI